MIPLPIVAGIAAGLFSFFRDRNAERNLANVTRLGDTLYPDPGYGWVDSKNPPLGVRWYPGTPWKERHLIAADDEGSWSAAPGYQFVAPGEPGNLEVRWVPGLPGPGNLESATREGGWVPRPGFSWTRPGVAGALDVHWTPGKPHNRAPHVFAGEAPLNWCTEDGYEWVSDDPEDLRVRPRKPPEAAPDPLDLQRLKDLAAIGLDAGAALPEIEAAYRRLAKIHHPDRFATLGAADREAAHAAFLRLRAAYDRLRRTV